MLARSGRLPVGGSWSYEVKWDGFRTVVSTEGHLLEGVVAKRLPEPCLSGERV
jgi:hypothetical protein